MSDALLETFSLGAPPWPTVDPFLFCVHHLDHYPAGDGRFAPAASLEGRNIGSDFSNTDGWSMYHGQIAPGFPQHPHRGFETVTFVRRGLIDHSDSLGASARYGNGDVQWMTAGAGIVHAEMFPLLNHEGPNTAEFFQIWVNLRATEKFATPHFSMLWGEDIPIVTFRDGSGRATEVTVAAGSLDGNAAPTPPPASWATKPNSDVAIWRIAMDPGATWTLPASQGTETLRVLYVFEGNGLTVQNESLGGGRGALLRGPQDVTLVAGDTEVQMLMLQGAPIGEPVVQYGPFVMNDRAGIEQAFADYRRTGFGGWPWPVDDPVHGYEGRFARRADGTIERPPSALSVPKPPLASGGGRDSS